MASLSLNGSSLAWVGVAFLATGFAIDPVRFDEDPVVLALRAELAQAREAWGAKEAELVSEVESLRIELRLMEERRLQREREWLTWTRAMTQLAPEGFVELPDFGVELSEEEVGTLALDEPAVELPRDEGRLKRSEEIERSLRTMLRLEWVDGLALLEAGILSDEGWTGPCVFRLIDQDRRAIGSVSAERLHLEGSLAGRTLTLVLSEGYERRAGDLVPFVGTEAGQRRGGERRIVLVHTDPRPWMEAMPELFKERVDSSGIQASGRTFSELQRGLNMLLAEDAAGGRWRLKSFDGLSEAGLLGVNFVDLDENGGVKRHLFADLLRVERRERGVVLVMTDGIQMRGGRKTPFLEGRYRIFLPTARQVGWEELGLLATEQEEGVEEAEGGTESSDGR
ncbi:MAG: hypothetical protein OSB14_03880 [Planctomycetota bacterium]|nr:hypothetical protein [Planctomycetota bacterium]